MAKTLTKADVFDVASDLIEQNGSTTTLDIKNELRKRGFFALQADVSQHMMDVCDEEGWSFSVSGNHRVYTDNASANSTASTSSNYAALANAAGPTGSVQVNGNQQVAQPAVNASGQTHVTRSGKQITSYSGTDLQNGIPEYWIAYSVISQDEYCFPLLYTRDDVRLAFRAFTGQHMHNIRARKEK